MRRTVQTILAFVLVVVVGSLVNMSRRADVVLTIDAPPDRVWTVLANRATYSAWNPAITRLEGVPLRDQPVVFDFVRDSGVTESLRGQWIEVRPGRSLTWTVDSGWGSWFERLYFIRLTPRGSGTEVQMGLVLTGVSVTWAGDAYLRDSRPAMGRMLQALSAYLEGLPG